MSTISVQVTYRVGKAFAAYLYLTQGPRPKAVRSEAFSESLVIDYSAAGSPIGIEIVHPGHVHEAELWSVFDKLGLSRPSSSELAPLIAA